MGNELSFERFLGLIKAKYRIFIAVGMLAAVLVVLSHPLFIKPRYLSKATVYPVNLNSYSNETRTDQLLQLLESNSIRDSLIKRFGLPEKYEVDTAVNGGYFALYNEFNDRVEISKTRLRERADRRGG